MLVMKTYPPVGVGINFAREGSRKGIRAPCSNHVKVKDASNGTEKCTALLERLDPVEKGEHEEEDGDGFIVVRASDGTRYVTGNNANESCSQQTSALVLHFFREPWYDYQ